MILQEQITIQTTLEIELELEAQIEGEYSAETFDSPAEYPGIGNIKVLWRNNSGWCDITHMISDAEMEHFEKELQQEYENQQLSSEPYCSDEPF